jgi:LasA protease
MSEVSRGSIGKVIAVACALFAAALACAPLTSSPAPPDQREISSSPVGQEPSPVWGSEAVPTIASPGDAPTPVPEKQSGSTSAPEDERFAMPTPDPPRQPPPKESIPEYYSVEYGDTLNDIAWDLGVSSSQIAEANGLVNPNLLVVNQRLFIPTPYPQPPGPDFKLLPDSEFVLGPVGERFDLRGELVRRESPLLDYEESVNDEEYSAAEIIDLIARRYSIDIRLLLAILEHQGGWLTKNAIPAQVQTYPLAFYRGGMEGLYEQLGWAANELSRGFYLWRAGWAGPYHFTDGVVVNPGQGINAATSGVQQLFSLLYDSSSWREVMGREGFYNTYVSLFGDPFRRAIEPAIPPDLAQPSLQLPFEESTVWSFTGGPHRAWGSGTAWAALDFAPAGDALGCVPSDAWVVAAGDGLIVRSELGEVVQDLDGDGLEGTGWALLYMHIESRDRVPAGKYVRAGEHIGHPSCEGGVADGTHVHLARKYNGEWIPADGAIPFNLDGWISAGWGREYDGTLSRDGVTLEACACREPSNQIYR